jgi:hypothetical protein
MARICWSILWAGVVFAAGFYVARIEPVQLALGRFFTGEYESEMLPDGRTPLDQKLYVWNRQSDALDKGAVLVTAEFSQEVAAVLLDEHGNILNRWVAENRLFNPETLKWWGSTARVEEGFSIDDARMLPNGDLIFVQGLMDINNLRGQRLARMDRNSHILWEVPGKFNHFISLGGEPQVIYTLNLHTREDMPDVAEKGNGIVYLDDNIESYSMDGHKLGGWSIVDAFARSPYRNWLSSFEINLPEIQRIKLPDGRLLMDLLHLNSVQYLDAKLARALPFAQAGDLLLSFRAISAIAVFRPSTEQIVWATKGPFSHQHNARIEPDGQLYFFDNDGRNGIVSSGGGAPFQERRISRVARFNPFTNQLDEVFSSPMIYSVYLGDYERTDNGSWVICSPNQGRVIVLSPNKQVVWQLRTVSYLDGEFVPHRRQFSAMHYYAGSALAFLHSDGTAP